MLRNRTFLFGLASGLIITALVLQIIYEADKVSSGEPPIVQSPPGIEELRELAGRLGYELVEQDQPLFTSEEVETKIQDALAKQPKQRADEKYAFTIGAGTDVSTIAYMLVEMGLIDDWRAFVDEINNRKLADSVQARYYIFSKKPDLKMLITELTTSKP